MTDNPATALGDYIRKNFPEAARVEGFDEWIAGWKRYCDEPVDVRLDSSEPEQAEPGEVLPDGSIMTDKGHAVVWGTIAIHEENRSVAERHGWRCLDEKRPPFREPPQGLLWVSKPGPRWG